MSHGIVLGKPLLGGLADVLQIGEGPGVGRAVRIRDAGRRRIRLNRREHPRSHFYAGPHLSLEIICPGQKARQIFSRPVVSSEMSVIDRQYLAIVR